MPIYCQWQRCSPWSVVSGDIRFMPIFVQVCWWGGVKWECGHRKCEFSLLIAICHVKFPTGIQFNIRGVSSDDDTKYYYVIAALDQDTAAHLLNTLQNPPENNKYSSLKTQLLRTYEFLHRKRAAILLDITSLRNCKPLAILTEMRALSSGHTNCMLFDELFLCALQHDIRLQLAEEDFLDNWDCPVI